MTVPCVVEKPRPAGQNLVEEIVGVWTMNSSVSLSNVAVVSMPRTNEPWPSSVCAYVPSILPALARGSHFAFCSAVPLCSTPGSNRIALCPKGLPTVSWYTHVPCKATHLALTRLYRGVIQTKCSCPYSSMSSRQTLPMCKPCSKRASREFSE